MRFTLLGENINHVPVTTRRNLAIGHDLLPTLDEKTLHAESGPPPDIPMVTRKGIGVLDSSGCRQVVELVDRPRITWLLLPDEPLLTVGYLQSLRQEQRFLRVGRKPDLPEGIIGRSLDRRGRAEPFDTGRSGCLRGMAEQFSPNGHPIGPIKLRRPRP